MREEELTDFGLVMEVPLINASTTNSRRNWCWKLKSRYSQTCVTSVPVILCLVWLGIIIGSAGLIPSRSFQYSYEFNLILSILNFVFPVCGYLGERWTRYYVIMTGTFIASGGCIMLQIVLLLENILETHYDDLVFALAITGIVAFSCGLGLFSVNIIQFSADQFPGGASSQQLASFARWWVFTLSFAKSIGISLGACLSLLEKSNLVVYLTVGILFFLSIAGIMIGICFRRKFKIELPRSVDPVKLIYQVIKYAWKHKYPERPSSFTYTDNNTPSRLDFGKERYGGPFTTDQVESVKSFGRILVVLLSSLLFYYYILNDYDYRYSKQSGVAVFPNESLSDSLLTFLNPNVFTIPILQLVVIPFFPWLIPSILKRIWLGLFLNVLCFSVVAISSVLVRTAVVDILVVCFGFVANFGSAIVRFSSLEFIFAQAPCDLQGLLIGIWFIQFNCFLYLLKNKVDLLIFYCVNTGLLILSLVTYSVAVYYYKYRVRNELSDINVQARIEEVYERDFRREDQETDNDESLFLSSVQSLHTCN